MPIVDTHTHVASGNDPQFPTTSSTLTSDWWSSGGSAAELLAELDRHGVDRVVLVQAIAAHGYDCSYGASAAAMHADRATFVAAIDMSASDPAQDLQQLLEDPPSGARIVGIRLFGVGDADTSWLHDGRGSAVVELATAHDVVVVPTIFADRFSELRSIAEAHPAAVFAIDHCGFTDMIDGGGESHLFGLSEIPSINLKVTSYVLEAAERDEGDPAPLTERLADAFGVERLCWGSDHPQDRRHDYAGKLALARRATRSFDFESREAFFNATGSRLFFS